MHTPSVKKGFLFSASPLAWGRGVAALCLQSAVRSRARWRWAGPEHRCGGGGGDWAAVSICVSENRLEKAGSDEVKVVSTVPAATDASSRPGIPGDQPRGVLHKDAGS